MMLDLEQQGAARRLRPAPTRRTWVRGDQPPSCATTRAALGTRASLLEYLAQHPGGRLIPLGGRGLGLPAAADPQWVA